jgi:hypothetical protein
MEIFSAVLLITTISDSVSRNSLWKRRQIRTHLPYRKYNAYQWFQTPSIVTPYADCGEQSVEVSKGIMRLRRRMPVQLAQTLNLGVA